MTFIEVYRLRSFQKAAEQLFLPQPTVSNRIIHLEKELGHALFIRGKKHILLTEEGEAFLPYAQRIIDSVTLAKEAVDQIRQGEKGKLTFGCTNALAASLLSDLMKDFILGYPNISYRIINKSSGLIIEMVKNQDFQVGLVQYAVNEPSLTFKRVFSEPYMLITSACHPFAATSAVTLQDIFKHPLIVYQRDTLYRKTLDITLQRLNCQCDFKFETNNIPFIKQLVADNQGAFLSSPSIVKSELASGKFRAVPIMDNPFSPAEIFLVFRPKTINSLDKLFIQYIESIFARMAA